MSITSYSILSSESLTANAAINALAAQQDLSAFPFNGVSLQLKLTNGATACKVGVPVTVYYAFGLEDYTGVETTIPAALFSKAQSFQLRTGVGANTTTVGVTAPSYVTAQYLYTWVSHDTMENPPTISLSYIGYAFGTTPQNITTKFREAFETYAAGVRWIEEKAAGDIVQVDGNTAGASYLVISKDPLSPDTVTTIETKARYAFPVELAMGMCRSQAVVGTEFSIELVDDQPILAASPDLTISAIQQATTTLTVTTTTPHGFVPGKRIQISGCEDSRLNYPALVVASIPTPSQFTATAGPAGTITSLSVGPYATGIVSFRSALGYSENGASMILENASATNASFYVRSEAGDANPSGTPTGNHTVNIGTTAPVQLINSAFTYAFQPTTEYKLATMVDRIQWMDAGVDSTGQTNSRHNRTQIVPSILHGYKFRVRSTNSKAISRPVAPIVSITKSGSTTWTVVTAIPHTLSALSFVNIYGNRDIVNFPNLITPTQVASIVSPTSFTIVSTTGTATGFGGTVYMVNGNVLPSTLGVSSQVGASVARTDNIVTAVMSASFSGAVIGDYINLHGWRSAVDGSDVGVDGPYRVQNIATATLTLEPIGNAPTGANIVSVNCGGSVIKRTDLRISYVRVLDYERLRIEALARPASDAASAMPVAIANSLTIGTMPSSTAIAGVGAHAATVSGHPVRVGSKAFTTIDTGVITGETADIVSDISNGAITVKPYGVSALDFNIVAAAGGTIVNSTTPVVLHAAPAAGIRNYVTGLSLNTDVLGTATELVLRGTALAASSQTISSNILTISVAHGLSIGDALVASASTVTGLTAGTTYYVLTTPATTTVTLSATRGGTTLSISGTNVTATLNHILWRTKLQTAGVLTPMRVDFATPLRGATANALEVVTLTASTGAVYFSAQGYQGQ